MASSTVLAQREKNKWLAGLLSFLIPGTGYFYLGQMAKGVAVMLLIAVNITAIVFAAIEMNNPLFVILLSLLLPIIYFYNLFDVIQSTDAVNAQAEGRFEPASGQPRADAGSAGAFCGPQPYPPPVPPSHASNGFPAPINTSGIILFAVIVVVILVASSIQTSSRVFYSKGSAAGAIVLIATGIGLWFWETTRNRGENNRDGNG